MSAAAARLLSSRRLLPATLALAAASTQRHHPIYLDGPTTAQDATLVANARRIQSKARPKETIHQQAKRGDAELIEEASEPDVYSASFEDEDSGAWHQFSQSFDLVLQGLKRVQWTAFGDKLVEFVIPSWAFEIPELIARLKNELSVEEGSLADEIWKEAQDPSINPEILWDARVRIGDTLCGDELRFREERKRHIVMPFARYLDLNEKDINPDDIPTIAMCGSGGGLRALVAGTSSFYSAQKAGLFDIVTYSAGVSGSCWMQTLFYSSLAQQDFSKMLKHIKHRVSVHVAHPLPALKLATQAPTNKFVLSGFVEKLKSDASFEGSSFGLVDIYSLLLTLRLMVPHGDLDVQGSDLKLSNQRVFTDNGKYPMPIYTAVRHEIPIDEEEKKESPSNEALKEKIKEKAKKESWFQWFESTPYEFGCEEVGGWSGTWAMGRPFKGGRNQILDTGIALPEYRVSLLLGIWSSAFTATLAHYYKEIRPILSGLSGFGGLDELLEEKNDDMIKVHPIKPAAIPNPFYGMKEQLPSTCPESIHESTHLELADAGMSNNLPIYPLLRKGRDVDVIIAFDASADVKQDNWLSTVDGWAVQKGIRAWPVGTGWPKKSSKPEENVEALTRAYDAASTPDAAAKLQEAKNKQQTSEEEAKKTEEAAKRAATTGASSDLGTCNIWVGSTAERTDASEPPPSKLLAWDDPEDTTFHLTQPDAGITVIYFPLLPNPKVPGVDPQTTEWLSTWNSVYTPEQVDKVTELARTNFKEGEDATKKTIRAVYERKKALREKAEKEGLWKGVRKRMREHGDSFG